MSKLETAVDNVIKKVYKYFDLETFESKEVEKEITFAPATTVEEATARVNGDPTVILSALNGYLRAQELAKAEREVNALGGRKSVVLAVVKPFRSMPPFDSIYELDAAGQPKKDKDGTKIIDRNAQTKAILDVVKQNSAMIEAIKAASLASTGDDENTED